MNKRSKGRMGDEEPVETSRRQMLRRPKIIIRKCKKPVKASKTIEDSNKVNGELSTKNKGNSKNKGNEETTKLLEVEVLNKKTRGSKKSVGIKTTKKRKLSESTIDSDVVVLDDDKDNTPTIVEENKSNGSNQKHDSPSVEFKGFKKRILAQTEKLKEGNVNENKQVKPDAPLDPSPGEKKKDSKSKVVKVPRSKKKAAANAKKGNEGDSDENQGDSQTEYAQYLGLQPTMQFKCYRCGERGFPSMLSLNMHQRGCGVQKDNFISNLQQDTSSFTSADPNMLTNFRITRKVYLCSACGTYYENWNLFLHMRDVHKKHICLFCLTMFGTAEKLADHLKNIHSVIETSFNSSEEFQNSYKGSCYLICCICENMFNERENYFHHQCEKRDPTAKCTLCGVKCGHYFTCPNSNTQRNVSTITKSSVAKNKATVEIWMGKKGQGDMYDISDAASFCHVALADESVENEKTVSDCNVVDLTEVCNDESNDDTPAIEGPQSSNISEKKDDDNNSNQADDQNEQIDNELGKLENVAPEQTCIVEKSTEEQEALQKGNEPIEGKPVEEIESDKEKEIKDTNVKRKNECDNLKELKNQSDSDVQNTEEQQSESDTGSSKEQPNENVSSEDKEDVEKTVNIEKPNEAKLGDDIQSNEKSNKVEINVVSSDSEREPDSHFVSQDNSDSSSDESTEEESKNKGKESIESKNETSLCESDDSGTSGLVVDEKLKDFNNGTEDNEKTTSKDNFKEKESVFDTKQAKSSETSKDFHLDDISSNEKDLEIEKDIEKDPDGSLANLPDSPSPIISDGIPLAGEDVPAMALTLEDKLEVASSQSVVKECVRTSCLNCVYCSHAIKIAVNGKQLALHLLAEHRYKPVKNNETSQDVVKKLKTSLNELESIFFNTDSYDSSDKSLNASYDYTYECFQCRFVTKVHKELYVHKRKMHQQTASLCVMCKSNFYSYSELLCHMCPGIYVSKDIYFRCCFCNIDMIPSAFRLMVHLRKSHHTCDTCLEIAGDQQKLSTHLWKHKLNHLCYRCGIAYRNKPDITKHLFWKHGTESVLCKKCLQKKWPHVYHFCIPPTVFICEECNASFTKAVALKVHKRLHSGEFPYGCDKCNHKFVSRKLLTKHEDSHNPPSSTENSNNYKTDTDNKQSESTDEHINVESIDEPSVESTVKDNSLEISKNNNDKAEVTPKSKKRKKRDKDSKPVLDVYDLPPLNLSSESDSSDEEGVNHTESLKEKQESDTITPLFTGINNEHLESTVSENVEPSEENQTPAPIVDGVWDNFHTYKAELEKRESMDLSLPNILPSTSAEIKLPEAHPEPEPFNPVLLDHSYCLNPGKPKQTGNENEETISEPAIVDEASAEEHKETPAPRGHSSSIDHAYATMNNSSAEGDTVSALAPDEKPATPPPSLDPVTENHSSSKKKQKTPKKKKLNANSSSSSDSSSDSDSTDCTCGPNCSCSNSSSSNSSSSSSSDSDSSTSEGRRKASARKEKKKERLKHKHHKEEPPPAPVIPPPPEEEPIVDIPVEPLELPIKESDLDTDESSTDEDFYDKHPQSHARQQLEKRNKLMLLASVAPVNNGTVSPPPPPPPQPTPPQPIEEEDPASQQHSPPAVKRKIKTKRRRKSQQRKKSTIKGNLTQSEPTTSLNIPNATSTPHLLSNHSLAIKVASPLQNTVSTFHSDATAGSGSENESARLSKRKRVRNKFYGYSSEEDHDKSNLKWRKVEPAAVPQNLNFQPTLSIQRPQLTSIGQVKRPESSESSATDEERVKPKHNYSNTSSSSSSESENEIDPKENVQKEQTEKSDNLYCYCQCPYDEVSEMIACDGQDCTIEWFHFECVGIMVPPKGKWYCPDCRKRRDLM